MKQIEIDRDSLIRALRLDGWAIPDTAEIGDNPLDNSYITLWYDETAMKRYKVVHYELKGYRGGEETDEEPGDWQSVETGTYTRVVEAEDLRKAIALAGPIPLP